jgi:hypothetical protein
MKVYNLLVLVATKIQTTQLPMTVRAKDEIGAVNSGWMTGLQLGWNVLEVVLDKGQKI